MLLQLVCGAARCCERGGCNRSWPGWWCNVLHAPLVLDCCCMAAAAAAAVGVVVRPTRSVCCGGGRRTLTAAAGRRRRPSGQRGCGHGCCCGHLCSDYQRKSYSSSHVWASVTIAHVSRRRKCAGASNQPQTLQALPPTPGLHEQSTGIAFCSRSRWLPPTLRSRRQVRLQVSWLPEASAPRSRLSPTWMDSSRQQMTSGACVPPELCEQSIECPGCHPQPAPLQRAPAAAGHQPTLRGTSQRLSLRIGCLRTWSRRACAPTARRGTRACCGTRMRAACWGCARRWPRCAVRPLCRCVVGCQTSSAAPCLHPPAHSLTHTRATTTALLHGCLSPPLTGHRSGRARGAGAHHGARWCGCGAGRHAALPG
jgi:hypothetical protein